MISAMDLTVRPSRGLVYIETLKMSPSAQAMAISACKSADFLLGFVVGKASDSLRTRWGRRRPFIAIGYPLALLCMLLFSGMPTYFFGTKNTVSVPEFAEGMSCADLKDGVTSAIAAGSLRPWNDTGALPDTVYAGAGVTVYFTILYFLYYVFGFTGTMIPYDALGMELTDDGPQRTKLFGIKTGAQFLGYTIPIILQMVLNMGMSSDVALQYTIMTILIAGMGLMSTAHLCYSITERPPPPRLITKEGEVDVPFIPAARRVFSNRPYLVYLAMRIPMTLNSLMPSNMMSYYVKAVMMQENVVAMTTTSAGISLLSAVICIPILVCLAKRFGKSNLLAVILFFEGIALICASLIPGTTMNDNKPLFYMLFFIVGASLSAGFVLPDAMLADVIDYDELLSGRRNEGMYTVIETNLQQLVEIVGGVLPLIVFESLGYENNGGCLCGCGVDCEKELGLTYARWYCSNDVGYSCKNAIGSELFFGDADRQAPCTRQNDGVNMAVRFFFAGLPGILALVAVIPAWCMTINAKMHKDIIAELAKREADPDYVCTDPVTGKPVILPANTEESLMAEHFSEREKQWASRTGVWLQRMKTVIGAQLGATGLLFVGLLAVMIGSGSENAITFACMGLAVIFLAVPWNVMRWRVLTTGGPTQAESR